ncbi:DUF1642 domain-containing protein [Lactococcus petauri]|uniref:DUF1642 domain-containing protein n=1 Tax=Lactococcus petauri TaxID=1940789 RepID=UPI0018AB894C|nr:DUF1642 domain-containing protein [Lactococcus petauri]MDC0826901.1 DUF1642 domain-containing protein [Lactococcus petauri]
MKKFEEIWKKANEEADSKYEPRGTLAWGVFLKEALEKRIEPLLKKQQPEIPEFVAGFVTGNEHELSKSDRIAYLLKSVEGDNYYLEEYLPNSKVISHEQGEKLFYWAENQSHETILKLWNGYTVAKEKRFYLKHKSVIVYDCNCGCGSSDTDELYLMADGNFAIFKEDAYKFTQQEIDSMETGSYEQIPVEENK